MHQKTEKIILDSSSSVGFFDSGIGGLTLLNHFQCVPIAQCFYVADTAHMPYGEKSPQEIKEFSEQIVDFLLSKGVSTIIISCHTATALALAHLKKKFPAAHIIGVIDLVAKEAVRKTTNNKIGVMATQATINNGAHKKALNEYAQQNIEIFEQACPLLASAVEFETHKGDDLNNLIRQYLEPLLAENIDTLILGSTHYDIIKETIDSLTNHSLNLISAHDLILQEFIIQSECNQRPQMQWYVTGDQKVFLNSCKKILAINQENLEKLDLNKSNNHLNKDSTKDIFLF